MNINKQVIKSLICLIGAAAMANEAWSVQPFEVTCGDGKTIEVADSKYNPNSHVLAQLCISAGHPPPVQSQGHMGLATTAPGQAAADGCAEWDPNSARLPQGTCNPPKKTIKYDPNCARLDGCSDQATAAGANTLGAKPVDPPAGPATLLLPAVQAAKSGTCGSNSSISAALDACGLKGFKSASCKKSGDQWVCTPSDDESDPSVRSTGFKNR